jgi:putative phosphoribosyl transferase
MGAVQFSSHEDAAEKLLDVLPTQEMDDEDWLILALSKNALPIVDYISRRTGAKFDFLFSEPLVAPSNPECLIGVVSESEEIVIQEALVESFGISLDFIYGEAKRKYEESILKTIYKYRKGASIPVLTNKNVLLVDDGCESGMRALSSLKTVLAARVRSAQFAAPIIPHNTAAMLESEFDGIYCVSRVVNFVNTEFYYSDYEQIAAEEVLKILESNRHFVSFQKSQGDE